MQPPDVKISCLARNTPVTIRTMTVKDRQIEADFVRSLSPESRYYRFHSQLRELTPELLERFTSPDYPRSMALIAVINSASVEQQIAVARYEKRSADDDSAEVAVAVADEWQGCGLATRMLTELRKIAPAAGIRTLHMSILGQNRRMLSLARKLGFSLDTSKADWVTRQLGKSIDSTAPSQE